MTKSGAKEPDFPIEIIQVPVTVGGKGPNGGSIGATLAGWCNLMKGQFLDDEPGEQYVLFLGINIVDF